MARFVSLDKIKLGITEEEVEEIKSSSDYKIIKDAIRKLGCILPILVEETKKGRYVVVDGKKRVIAARELGLEEILITEDKDELKDWINKLVKLDPELKQQILSFIKTKNLSLRRAEKLLGIPDSTIWKWQRKLMKQKPQTPKWLTILQYIDDEPKSISKIAEEMNVTEEDVKDMLLLLKAAGFVLYQDGDLISIISRIPDDWTKFLTQPRTLKELTEKFKVDAQTARVILEVKRREGWDIREIIVDGETKYFLSIRDEKSAPTFQGIIQLPFAIISDVHIGSTWFDEGAFSNALDIVAERGINTILFPGDILQGVGVYAREDPDLAVRNIDEQIQLAVDIFESYIPENMSLHFIMGNHEYAVKSKTKVGFDPILGFVNKLSGVRPDLDLNYYGLDATLVISNLVKIETALMFPKMPRFVSFESPSLLYMMHGSGQGAYAISYPAQKILRSLPYPANLVVIGHYHQLAHFKIEGVDVILPGTFQSRSHYFIGKGSVCQKGFVILEKEEVGSEDNIPNSRLKVDLISL